MFPVEEKLTPATENWMSVNPSQTPHYVSPRLIQLIGISRNKQNKALHHQCCLHLSFYMPIIWALPYLPLPLFVPNIVFYLPLPSSVSLALSCCPCSPTPTSSSHCNGQLPWVYVCVCAVCLYWMLWVASTGWLKGIKNDSYTLNTGPLHHKHTSTHRAKKRETDVKTLKICARSPDSWSVEQTATKLPWRLFLRIYSEFNVCVRRKCVCSGAMLGTVQGTAGHGFIAFRGAEGCGPQGSVLTSI